MPFISLLNLNTLGCLSEWIKKIYVAISLSEHIYSQNTVAYTDSYMEFLSLSENITFVPVVYLHFLF